jgi:hypothetical protein
MRARYLPDFRLLPDFERLASDPCLIPAVRSLVPAASSRGGMIARTAPAAAPAITLTAVFFRALVAPLVPREPLFLRPVRVPPDRFAPFLDPPVLEDDFLRGVSVPAS